jgi:diacylglycerol kinase (ATP)
MKSTTLVDSFRYAFAGLSHALRSQRNMRIHAVISTAVVIAGVVFRVSAVEWAVLIVTIALVVQAELFNTALEAVVDKASPERHPLAKIAKDCAAASVVVCALAAVGVGVVIFLPRLLALVLP